MRIVHPKISSKGLLPHIYEQTGFIKEHLSEKVEDLLISCFERMFTTKIFISRLKDSPLVLNYKNNVKIDSNLM